MTGVVDYDAGNIRSVSNALKSLGAEFIVTDDVKILAGCDGIILPGVGAATGAMRSLKKGGLVQFLRSCRKPFLGICLGMQVLMDRSEEGDVACLGIIPGTVKKFDQRAEKIPHMGWNSIQVIAENPLLDGLPRIPFFYFAHSYYAPVADAAAAITSCGILFASAMRRDNYFGVQFHPEKSGPVGLTVLRNFIAICKSSRQ